MFPRIPAILIALGFALVIGGQAAAAPCAAPVGTAVTLRSTDFDPDVFVWDSKTRVAEYAGGHWKNTSDVMNHTLLAKPNTKAVIVACEADKVRSRYADALEDSIGVRILSGINKGKYGWVTSEDVHGPALRTASVASP